MPLRFSASILLLLSALVPVAAQTPAPAPATPAPLVTFTPPVQRTYPRPVESTLEAQIALARRGLSSGPIDGVAGAQTAAALQAFQQVHSLPLNGRLDDATRAALTLDFPPLTQTLLTAEDLDALEPTGKTWLEKSAQSALAHETALELAAERAHAHPRLIKALNPSLDWAAPASIAPGTAVSVPAVPITPLPARAARIEIRLATNTLQVFDDAGNLLAHFPVSIARKAEKRPVGDLSVTVVIAKPNYTFDPANFPESPEAKADPRRKLILAPGPNNPVGIAWIGLSLPGYGIHGTPTPEHVGRTESIGCFRLANWDALTLLELAWVGLPVTVVP